MNKRVVRRYILEIKAVCPFRDRIERKYLSWFSNNVWVYCEENDIQDIDELYRQFGKPNDVVNNYLTGMDIDEISNKIVKSRWIKRILAGILIVIIVTSLTLVGIIYREYKVLESE